MRPWLILVYSLSLAFDPLDEFRVQMQPRLELRHNNCRRQRNRPIGFDVGQVPIMLCSSDFSEAEPPPIVHLNEYILHTKEYYHNYRIVTIRANG